MPGDGDRSSDDSLALLRGLTVSGGGVAGVIGLTVTAVANEDSSLSTVLEDCQNDDDWLKIYLRRTSLAAKPQVWEWAYRHHSRLL